MKALYFDETLRYTEQYPEPPPGADEVLVAVKLAGICATDMEITRGYMDFKGVIGHEFVGTVAAGPRRWKGKRVVAEINCVCGKCQLCQQGLSNHCRRRTVLGIAGRDGAFAEYVTVPERNLHEVPEAVSDEQAVFVEPLAAAYQVIMQCPVEKHMRVAVVGTGRLGLLVGQVLRNAGCDLKMIGRSERTLSFCEKKGIQTRHVSEMNPKADHDLVVDCTGSPEGFRLALNMVRPRGTLVLKSTYAGEAPVNLAPVVINEINMVGSRCGPFAEAINALARQQIDVETMISRQLPLNKGEEAMELAADPNHVKVLLKVGT